MNTTTRTLRVVEEEMRIVESKLHFSPNRKLFKQLAVLRDERCAVVSSIVGARRLRELDASITACVDAGDDN